MLDPENQQSHNEDNKVPKSDVLLLLDDIQQLRDSLEDQVTKIENLTAENQHLATKLVILKDQVVTLQQGGGLKNPGSSSEGIEVDHAGVITSPSSEKEASYSYYRRPRPLLYFSYASRLLFAICFGIAIILDVIQIQGKTAMNFFVSASLFLSVVTLFSSHRDKKILERIICITGWLINLVGTSLVLAETSFIIGVTTSIEFSHDDVQLTGLLPIAFLLLAIGHALELLHLLVTRRIQQKAHIVALSCLIIGFLMPTIHMNGYGSLIISLLAFVVHALIQYVALFYDVPPGETIVMNDSGSEEELITSEMMDSYAFMMVSSDFGKWHFAFIVYGIQVGLAIMILVDQLLLNPTMPSNVPLSVWFAQFLGVFLSIFWQSDIITSLKMLDMLWYKGNEGWPYQKIHAKDGKLRTWFEMVLFPNVLRFAAGIFVLATSFVIIMKSETVLDLFKDFTALILISNIDNMAFSLADQCYFGKKLKDETDRIKKISFVDKSEVMVLKKIPLRLFVLLLISTIMIVVWIFYLVFGQVSGKFFMENHPTCKVDFTPSFLDGVCNPGEQNTAACGFDGGDCIEFNSKYPSYPDCNVEDYSFLGDGYCNSGEYNTEECGFDDGDCFEFNSKYPDCNVDEPFLIGDGMCINDDEYNTKECGFDGGDCVEFPDCNVENPSYIGDGRCHGKEYNTEECGFDGGDCIEFNSKYPDCNVDEPFLIGDGSCDDFYAIEKCGWDGGDCSG
jgi:hypothetical protein